MATYGDIRTKFLARLNRRDCTTALADGFLDDAIQRVQRLLRVPAGEKGISVALDNDSYFTDGGLAIPSDFLRIKDIIYTNSAGFHTTLIRRPLDEVNALVDFGTQGTTWAYARENALWVFGPSPLSGETIRVDYYSEFAGITSDSDETILLAIASDLILYGALSYAADHWMDKRREAFEGRFTQILADLQAQADDDELQGNPEVRPAYPYPSDDS
jgi:hypothetical protein